MKAINCLAIFVGLGVFVGSQGLLAAPMKKASSSGMASQSGGGKGSGRDWLISLPVIAERPQLRLHAEYNAARSVGLAIEAAAISSSEELSEEDVNLTGASLAINGLQASVLMSRYSDEANMGGFFWSVGAGYRKWSAEWKKKPDEKEALRLSLVDEDGYLHHRVEGKGGTGHIRMGYRYVASEWPLAIGAHVGIRHMNSQVKDVDVPEDEEKKLNLRYSEATSEERKSLKNKMMTTPDFTVDFGVAF